MIEGVKVKKLNPIPDETAYSLNIPTFPYNRKEPDEYRLPPDTDKIPYDWILTPGKKHG